MRRLFPELARLARAEADHGVFVGMTLTTIPLPENYLDVRARFVYAFHSADTRNDLYRLADQIDLELADCDCEFDPYPDSDEPSWHYRRVCQFCACVWWSLHCPHDGAQGECPDCGRRPITVP